MSNALRIEGLAVEARAPTGEWFDIVRGVDLRVKQGEVVALIGESGAGKTTLGLAALGYARPGTRIVGGHIQLGETDVLALTPAERRRLRGRRVAYVAQSAAAAFNPAIRIGDQIAEACLVHDVAGWRDATTQAIELLDGLKLPSPRRLARRYPHQLSGGQQQRAMVAMAMACKPELFVFDEPTTALDVTTQIEVLWAIQNVLRDTGGAALYVSHDLAVVAQVADRIVVLRDGSRVEEGPSRRIVEQPAEPYTVQLLEAVRPPPVRAAPVREKKSERCSPPEPCLAVCDIRASYAKHAWLARALAEDDVLQGVSVYVGRGEVVALVGESGSGKSTLARVAAGLHAPLSGEVRLQGERLAPRARNRARDQLRRIQIVFQSPDTALNPEERVGKALSRPLDLYFRLDGDQRRRRIDELLTMVGLRADYAERFPAELSGGERQRVSLARAFAADPDVIICDEVLSSLDTVVSAAVLDLLKDLQSRLGVACLFISHDLATVSSIAQRVVVLYAGIVCEDGPTERVFSPPYHPYTALLMASVPELRHGWLEEVAKPAKSERSSGPVGSPDASGCPFHPRCPLALDGLCDREPPPARQAAEDHVVFCHRTTEDLVTAQLSGPLASVPVGRGTRAGGGAANTLP